MLIRHKLLRLGAVAVGALVLAGMLTAAGCGGGGSTPTGGRARHARLVRDLEGRRAGVREGERPPAAHPPGRRRQRDAQPGAPHRRRPPGRRHLRDRRQRVVPCGRGRPARGVPLPGALGRRPRLCRARPARHADRSRRGLPERRPGLVHVARGGAADEPRRSDPVPLPEPARGGEPRDLLPRARVPPRDGRDVRRPLGGVLARAPGERRPRRRRLGGGVHPAVLRRGREPRQAADRRLVRDEPGRRGDLRLQAAHGLPDSGRRGGLLPPGRVRGDPARRAERGRREEADRLHALGALPGGRPGLDVRLPGPRRSRAPRGVREARDRARTTRSSSPRRRSTRTATAGSPGGPTSSCADPGGHRRPPGRVPRGLLRMAARGDPRAKPRRRRLGRSPLRRADEELDPRGRLVHALAGDRVHGAHADRGPSARLGAGAVPVPRQIGRRGARARAVRAADRRRGDGVPRAAPRRDRAHGLGDPPRARVLQRRGRRSRRRRVLGAGSTSACGTRRRRSARRPSTASSASRLRCSRRRSRPPPRSCSSSASRPSA